MSLSPTVKLAQQLIQKPSITPEDAGCQELIGDHLDGLGFHLEPMNFGDVTNLWARRGTESPLVVFAGHTDVVPTGPRDQWQIPPFEGRVENGMLHGRGAADMKGSIACFVTACERFVEQYPEHRGSIGLLITSDEEGPAIHGTKPVVEALSQRQEHIDMCLVGEPSSTTKLGDVVKVGRRGSLNATLKIKGKQGHIAYPHQADNPLHRAMSALDELIAVEWDQGNENFQPTSLHLSNINGGTGATNVIPGEVDILFNFRFSPESDAATLQQQTEDIFRKHGLDYEIQWQSGGQPFETKKGELIEAVIESIREVTGNETTPSTSGGTSDGRFIAPTGTQVVELGPRNATIHQIDEQVSVDDLDLLTECYERILIKLLVE